MQGVVRYLATEGSPLVIAAEVIIAQSLVVSLVRCDCGTMVGSHRRVKDGEDVTSMAESLERDLIDEGFNVTRTEGA